MIIISKQYSEQIKEVCSTAASRSSIQAFENIYILAVDDGLTLKAGDSMVELTRHIECEVKSGFETTVNASKFIQAFSACGDDVKIIVKDKMTISSGRKKFTLPIIDAESYPAYQDMVDANKIECPGFIDAIKSASWAAGKQDARYVFNGVCVRGDAVGTNGHKMSVVPLGADCDIIIPIDTIKKMPNYEGDIYVSENVLAIKGHDFEFKTKLIDGQYPDYNRAIPKCSKSVSIDLSELKDAVKAAQITANSQFKTVIFNFGKESSVTSHSADKREDSSIDIACDASEEFTFAVNSSYLIEALNELTLPNVEMAFSDGQMMIEEAGRKLIICAVRL